jgi:hypothetical protein
MLATAALIGTGNKPAIFTLNEAREEQQKRLGSALLLGAPVVSLNNVNGKLASDELAAYLTEGGCITRAYATVGGTKFAPNGNVISASGNNIMLGGDLPERALVSRQDAKMERPSDRIFQGSPHNDVRADRGKYLAAVFTIARWVIRGADYQPPKMGGFGGFDDFNCLIRAPLLALTKIDPLERSCGEMQTTRQHQSDRVLVDALSSLVETEGVLKTQLVSTEGRFCLKDIQNELRRHLVEQDGSDPWALLRHESLPYRLQRARGRRGSTAQLVSTDKPIGGADVAWYQLVPLSAGRSGPADPADFAEFTIGGT